MTQGYFVTGTDTGIGKTWSTLTLMQYFQAQGRVVIGMKPVASGCEQHNGELRNEDALLIQEQSSILLPYQDINPYAFAPPVSPHIAAKQAGRTIDLDVVIAKYRQLEKQADIVIVEGVGGWLVPLNEQEDVADLAERLDLPVIVVVGMRLGCLSQAKLTFAAIRQKGLACHGWIASCVDPDMRMLDENIQTLCQVATMPLLAVFPYEPQLNTEHFCKKFRQKM